MMEKPAHTTCIEYVYNLSEAVLKYSKPDCGGDSGILCDSQWVFAQEKHGTVPFALCGLHLSGL